MFGQIQCYEKAQRSHLTQTIQVTLSCDGMASGAVGPITQNSFARNLMLMKSSGNIVMHSIFDAFERRRICTKLIIACIQ